MILILCNNCNGHNTIDPENWEFILDSENRICGISFKRSEIKSVTHYTVKHYLPGSIPWDFAENGQPFFSGITMKNSTKPMKLAQKI